MPKVTITYEPTNRGGQAPAIPDERLAELAFALSERYGFGQDIAVSTSTGALVDALVRRVILGWINPDDMTLTHIQYFPQSAHSEDYRLDRDCQWVTSDGVPFKRDYPQTGDFNEMLLRHMFEVHEEEKNA